MTDPTRSNPPLILSIRPGAKLSAKDRAALREAGVIVIHANPEDVQAIQPLTVAPANEMLRHALSTIESAGPMVGRNDLRAAFAKRLIESYLQLGETK